MVPISKRSSWKAESFRTAWWSTAPPSYVLDQYGQPQGERRLHPPFGSRREKHHHRRSARRHVHSEATPARKEERQALLVRPGRHARDASQPRWVEHRDPRRHEPRRSPAGPGCQEMVRRHCGGRRRRQILLDPEREPTTPARAASSARISSFRAGQTPANRQDIELLYDNLPEPIDLDLDVAHSA